MNRFRFVVLALTCVLTVYGSELCAQESGKAASQKPVLTLQTSTRIVLTDVTVTDAKGNPVKGLEESDFHIFDDGKPQKVLSFTAHTTKPATAMPRASTAPGVYSNRFVEHLPPVLNIILIDTTNLRMVDQMYLSYKLGEFVKRLSAGEPFAVYWRTGPHSILLQNFTSDHALLLTAIHEALPHFMPTGREYYSDLATLYKIAVDFGQYPGRKNILWFTGGSTLFLNTDPTTLGGLHNIDSAEARVVYDMLESGRIAVYPVDARGLLASSGGVEGFMAMTGQRAMMNDAAEATGGRAYYDNNGFDHIAQRWLKDSGDFYTLTYSPSDFKMNNKWHKVRIRLDPGEREYSLSYRRGYFADGTKISGHSTAKIRSRLLADRTSVKESDLRSKPIIFQAEIRPASEMPRNAFVAIPDQGIKRKRGTIPYAVEYLLPAQSFGTKVVDGKTKLILGVGVLAFKQDGSRDAGRADSVTLTVDPGKLRQHPNFVIPVEQHINLHKGNSYLYLAVWDMNSGRQGTLQIRLKVVNPEKAH